MKIMLDSNILISAGVFNSVTISNVLQLVKDNNYTLILSDSIVNETRNVVKSRIARFEKRFLEFFESLEYELVILETLEDYKIKIRDENDKHVIMSAIQSGIDVLITGDNDFFDEYYCFEVLRPADFLIKYGTLNHG